MMAETYMLEEALLYHDIWGSDFINWFDAGGMHIFGDMLSDKSDEQLQHIQRFYQYPMFVFYF